MSKRIIGLLLALVMSLSCTTVSLADSLTGEVDSIVYVEGTSTDDPAASADPVVTETPAAATPETTPDAQPTSAPTTDPGTEPTVEPSGEPTTAPSDEPTATPGTEPTQAPSAQPTELPTATPVPTAAPLSIGSRGNDVLNLQKELTYLGFLKTTPDGIFGNNTKSAVIALQSYLALLNVKGTVKYSVAVYGEADSALLALLDSDSVPAYYATVEYGSRGAQVTRVQTRLAALDYLGDGDVDGIYGNDSKNAISDFQKSNGLTGTGIADAATQNVLFSATAKKCDASVAAARYPYKLVIDVSDQRVYVYKYNNGSYSKLVNKFTCSTGKKATPTPLGTYNSSTGQIDVWHYFSAYNCWAQYAYRITGAIYFHSVIFSSKGASSPTSSSVRNLGSRASHGCVRLSVANAKWIYYNCPRGTTVVVRN